MAQNNSSHILAKNSVDFQKFINNNRLINEYQFNLDESPLGHGAYGVVIKATNKIDEKEYAIKMIEIRGYDQDKSEKAKTIEEDFNDKMRELKVWAKITDQDYCVQFISAWLERDDTSKRRFVDIFCESLDNEVLISDFRSTHNSLDLAVLHIKMDLCSMSLSTALTQMERHFNIRPYRAPPQMAYYISSELLYEILEALNYLHIHSIIHRDVKPDNILIKFSANGRCIKLGDFGLAVLHEAASQSHTQNQGTDKYMAPEVRQSRKYSFKADIYSIGVIIQKMFNFDINRKETTEDQGFIDEKSKSLVNITIQTLNGLTKGRPTCQDILDQRDEWTLPYMAVGQDIENSVDLSTEYNTQREFVKKFLQTKRFQNEN